MGRGGARRPGVAAATMLTWPRVEASGAIHSTPTASACPSVSVQCDHSVVASPALANTTASAVASGAPALSNRCQPSSRRSRRATPASPRQATSVFASHHRTSSAGEIQPPPG